MHKYPFISFILPTYNAEKFLEKCLNSIFMQNYPKDKFEIIVSDGFSKDNTRTILSNYDIELIDNLKVNSDYGKLLALKKAKGDYIVFIDSDNIIADTNWLAKMIDKMLEHRLDFMESNYLIADNFTSINTYANLLVIVDPLARMLSSKPESVTKLNDLILKRYKMGSVPVAGANGFIFSRKIIFDNLDHGLNHFAETNFLTEINKKQEIVIGNLIGYGIYHYYCESFYDYFKKRNKIGNKFLNRKINRNKTWLDGKFFKVFFSSLYLMSVILPTLEAFYYFYKTKRYEWFWHPIISFLTIIVYIIVFTKNIFRLYAGTKKK